MNRSAPDQAPSSRSTVLATPRLLDIPEAAIYLGLGRRTTWALVKSQELRSVKIGRRRLVPTEYADEFVEVCKAKAAMSDGSTGGADTGKAMT